MVCTQIDDFIKEKSVWVAVLSNGETIYADDNRDGLEPKSAWKRLKEYVSANNLQVVRFGIKFRSHQEWLPDNCPGYFFANGIGATLFTNKNINYQILGYVEDGKIICRHFIIPSLLVGTITVRDLKDSPSLLMNPQ
jgi:hypothetical protein